MKSCTRCNEPIELVGGTTTQVVGGWHLSIQDGFGMFTDNAEDPFIQFVGEVLLCHACCVEFTCTGRASAEFRAALNVAPLGSDNV
jgi:hypothetical protein